MPGETTVRLSDIGTVLEGIELQQYGQVGAMRPLADIRFTGGDCYTLLTIDGVGIGLGSRQSQRIFVITARTLVDLAKQAGVDGTSIIVHDLNMRHPLRPDQGGNRG